MKSFYLLSLCTFSFFLCSAQSALDRSFADTGVTTLSVGEPVKYFNSSISQILPLPGGKFYLLQNGGSTITRRNSNGDIDLAYGINGHSVAVSTTGIAGALQPDGKVVLTGADPLRPNEFAITRINSDGTLDRKFGVDGYQFSSFNDPVTSVAIALQNDGKIVVGGTIFANNEQYFLVARYTSNGVLDPGFGTDGYQVIKFEFVVPDREDNYTERTASLSSLAIEPDGKVLAAGYAYDGVNSGFAVTRLTSSGNLDLTFDADGKQAIIRSTVNAWASDVLIQPDGKILVTGSQESASGSQLVAMRMSPDGKLENGYGMKGISVTDNSVSIFIDRNMKQNAVLQSGDLVLSGFIDANGWDGFYVTRLKSNGKIDKSFAKNGEYIYQPEPNTNISAGSVALQSGNRLLVGGTITYENDPATNSKFVVLALDNSGDAISSFGTNGLYADKFIMAETSLNFSVSQPDGKILTGGYAWNGLNNDFLLARYSVSGKIDKAFNTTGFRMTDFGGDDQLLALSVNGQGKILAYGKSDTKFAMSAYNLSGAPSNIQSGPGTFTLDPGQPFTRIVLQDDGKLVLAGSTYDGISEGQASLVKLNADGSFDKSFDNDGKKIDPLGFDLFYDVQVTIQGDGKIILLGRTSRNGLSTIVLVRYNADGTRDASFGSGGVAVTNFGDNNYFGTDLKALSDGKIVVAAFSQTPLGDQSRFVVARFLANGNLDTGFGVDGLAIADFNGIFEYSNGLAINADGKIAVGGTAAGFAVAVFTPGGQLDKTFSGDGLELHQVGIQTARTGYAISQINQLIFNGDFLYATGNTYLPNLSGALARYLLPQSGALPVTTLNLTGKLSNTVVNLDWKFASDNSISGFTIERSNDGLHFSDLGNIAAVAPFNIVRSYQSIDYSPASGFNYYRLKVVSTEGQITYSNIIVIRVDGFGNITIFPTPASDHIYFNVTGNTGGGRIEIYDLGGRRVKVVANVADNSRVFIGLGNLPAGAYNLKYIYKGGSDTRTFIKQ